MVDYILRISLENHSIITIIYQKDKEITEREIKVIRMSNNKIEAFCYLRHQIRFFKKENILAASLYQEQSSYLH